ncbi:putative Ig domain-containing protein [Curtobacterium sp. MCPF17_002]|uniref:putative Ig domain-containing protein n=1 Tax=Curtobacterium sp. MCPF17_002 TaxID=2175645 RepID=UPI000DAA21CA|nr:putative Ig domain-containing protein [Curtobacterium sp. MCPF17_002]WIB78820.1 putative Ig domain-containing protein [Curtobacterium sp. MCPF17_002]
MKQSCTSTFRRSAAVGAAVAIVTASSAFGLGATAAVADTPTSATTEATSQPSTAPDSDAPGAAAGSTAPDAQPAPAPAPAPGSDSNSNSEPDAAGTTDPTPSVTPTPDPSPAAVPADTATTPTPGGVASVDAASVPVTWSEASSPEDRIVLQATAGEPFSHTFVANGGDGPLEYLFNPHTAPDGLHWDEKTGVLSGTLNAPDWIDVDVAATDQHQSATQWVRVEVQPGAATHIGAQVYSNAEGHDPAWSVAGGPDGGIAPIGGGGLIDAVPVEPGGSLWLSAVVTDRLGNPLNGPEMPTESTLTSSDSGDVLTWNAETNTWKVTFGDAASRSLTMNSEGLALTIPVAVADRPLAFTGSGATQTFRTTAGESFSQTFTATGSTKPVRYVLQYDDDEYVDPEHSDARIPDHLPIDRDTGVLSGTPTVAGEYRFRVVATDGSEIARQEVQFTVAPGVTKNILTFISTGEDGKGTVWGSGPGKQLTRIDGLGEAATYTPVDTIPVDQGKALFVKSTPVDAWGNTSVPLEAQNGDPHPVVTSSVATDRIDFSQRTWSNRVTFTHASLHRISVTFDGVSDSFDVAVSPAAGGAGTGGTLAYTGADETGPLAWALGLLAAGGGLLVHRLRRRRS